MANPKLARIRAKLVALRDAIDEVAGRRTAHGHPADEVPTEPEAEGLVDIRQVIERDLGRLDDHEKRSDQEIRSFALRVGYSSKLFDENGVPLERFPVIADAWRDLSNTALDIFDGK